MPARTCRYCGRNISDMRAGSTVCRRTECREQRKADWQRARRGGRPCPVCGSTITAANRRYCSDGCLREYRRAYMLERYHQDREANRARNLAYYHAHRAGHADHAAAHLAHARAHYARHADDPDWMQKRRALHRAWRSRLDRDPQRKRALRERAAQRRGQRRLALIERTLTRLQNDDSDC